jgi:hypothetical protein
MLATMSNPCRRGLARTLAGAFACAGALVLIAAPSPAGALAGTATNGASATIPVPATAKPPGAAGGAAAPGSASAASTTTQQLFGTTPAGATPPATKLGQSKPTPATTHASPHSSGGVSTAAIIIAVIAGLLALGCAAWAIARAQAFEPHWLLSARHAMSEAGVRASSTWSEFSDWVRLGR